MIFIPRINGLHPLKLIAHGYSEELLLKEVIFMGRFNYTSTAITRIPNSLLYTKWKARSMDFGLSLHTFPHYKLTTSLKIRNDTMYAQ